MPVKKEHRLPKVGKTFTRNFKGTANTLEIVRDAGKIAYKTNDNIFSSPSAAAKSITHTEINGWVFWGLEE